MTRSDLSLEASIRADGTEPAVVLLHSLAMDHSIWNHHVEQLASRYPTVTCDLPGHGKSGTVTDVSVEWMADQVARLLDTTPFDRVIVAGLSLGGCVAQALAVRHPQLVAGLCLVDTTAWYGPDAPANWEKRAQKAALEGFDALSEFQRERWFSPAFRAEQPDVGDRLMDVFRSNDIDSYVAVCRAMGRFDARELIGEITVPVTVMVGELDPATPIAHARELAKRIPGAQLKILAGASHLSPVERPAAFIAEIDALHALVRATN